MALTGDAPVDGPGVQLVSHLSAVRAEVVRARPAALRALSTDRRVAGLRADSAVRPMTASLDPVRNSADSDAVLGWQGLAEPAGQAGAGHGVTVAVVDTGISDTPALNRASGRLLDGVDTSALAEGGQERTAGPFPDGFGHGTFLANLLAGGETPGLDSGTGRNLGVAPAARVVAVKVADDRGVTSLSAVLAGLDWVASHRPIDLVSLSLAADRPEAEYGADPLTMAVRHLRHSGLPVVVAAGNTPGEVGDPGFDPQALTVGAADTSTAEPTVAPFSGSGQVYGVRKPDLVATGVHVQSLLPADSVIARDYPQAQLPSGFWRGSGTSEATAVAAGAVAVYLAGHPGTSPDAVGASFRAAAGALPDPRAGAGLLAVPAQPGTDQGGEGFDRRAWWANAWTMPGWVQALNESWTRDRWYADPNATDPSEPWSAKSWSGTSWSAKSWSAKSWSAKSWSAKSWSAKSWSAKSWSAKSWSAASWGDGGRSR